MKQLTIFRISFKLIFFFLNIGTTIFSQQTTETFNEVSQGTYNAGVAVGAFKFSSNNGTGVEVDNSGSNSSNGVWATYAGSETTTFTVKRVSDIPFDFISIFIQNTAGFGSETYKVEGYLSSVKKYNLESINVNTASVHTFNWENIDEIRFIAVKDVAATFDDITYTVTASPVELVSFNTTQQGNVVKLNWQTATEINNYGFSIERAIKNAEFIIDNWEEIAFIEGHGNSNSPKSYEFIDETAPSGNLEYRLKQIDTDGQFKYYSLTAKVNIQITDVKENELPIEFALEQNYPNPFNPTTTINYSISVRDANFASPTNVTLIVYDMLGREVATLVSKQQAPGNYSVNFDASNLPSGMYIYKIHAGSFKQSRKMLLLR